MRRDRTRQDRQNSIATVKDSIDPLKGTLLIIYGPANKSLVLIMLIASALLQGSHKLWKSSWKTWKITKKKPMQGKVMEFEKKAE